MKKKYLINLILTVPLLFISFGDVYSQIPDTEQNVLNEQMVNREKTSFQTGSPWKPTIDIRSDIAMVYGVGDRKDLSFEQRIQSWREQGYSVQFMTGIAWGSYQDYFLGKWDGKSHLDEAQVEQNGDTVWHGKNSPYYVPTENYLKYFKEQIIKKVIDAGINSIYLEEPEFWAKSGYSSAFKNEWKNYYGFDWRPQQVSAENTYLSNKLKYFLYFRALKECFAYAKQYGNSKGRKIYCYVATHSLLNYSLWEIVSPEASLASLPEVDGYIDQTWTGTAREPNYFNGIAKSRTFATAFLEYGCMSSMTMPTNRKLFFENDPVEDVRRDWADYKKNYQATFTAQLFYPGIDNYEVMPWPSRIFDGKYYVSVTSDERASMPKSYSTQLLVMINSLNNINITKQKISGSHGLSVLMSNSLMFQRLPTHDDGKAFKDPYFSNFYETSGMFNRFPSNTKLTDPELSDFYGEALPFLLRGVPVSVVHLENVGYQKAFDDTKILLMSYSDMKPMSEKSDEFLADWVRKGGIIVYSGRDDDPFQTVSEWWNTNGNHYSAPSQHLFQLLGIKPKDNPSGYKVGKGKIYVIRQDPKEFVLNANGDRDFVQTVKRAYEVDAKSGTLQFKNNFYLERGPYDVISVMDETEDISSYKIKGELIDLFDPTLPVLTEKEIKHGEQSLLFDVDRVANKNKPQVLASASRVYDEVRNQNSYSFVAKSPLNTINAMRILLPAKAMKINVSDSDSNAINNVQFSWDEKSKTLFLGFDNSPKGIKVKLSW